MNCRNLLLILFISFVPGLSRGGSAPTVPNQDRYKKVFFQTLENLNKTLETKKTPTLTVNANEVKVEHRSEIWGDSNIEAHVNPRFGVEFFPNSAEVMEVHRNIPLEWLGLYDEPPKPTWSPEQAIKEATFWYEAVIGKLPKNLGTPTAEFSPTHHSHKYRNGQWTVTWPRVDGKGHQFRMDNVYCTLDEKWGADFLSCIFVSKFTEGQKVAISRDQAIQIAMPFAKKLLSAPITAPWSKGYVLKPDATAELQIVNPNHILKYNSIEEVPTDVDLAARLVWIVKCHTSNDKGANCYIYLWVDTETKEVIGGDFNDK